MKQELKQELKQQVEAFVNNFHLPRYNEIPNVGLYLEQVTKYISEYLQPLGDFSLTSSMISNYVKKGLIESPLKKQYNREQIAYLFFIALAKNVLSLDALAAFIKVQQQSYALNIAYDYFCDQFEAYLQFTFELSDTVKMCGKDTSDEKRLLFTCIASTVQKVYLEKCLKIMTGETSER